jgi:hypothetical protein
VDSVDEFHEQRLAQAGAHPPCPQHCCYGVFKNTGDDEKETIHSSFERRHPILLPVPERPG